MSLGDVGSSALRELWELLDEVQEAGFSLNPLDLVDNIRAIGELIQRVWTIASEPPAGDVEQIEAAAQVWRQVSGAMDDHAGGLRAIDVAQVWSGEAASACTLTVRRLATRYDDAVPLAQDAYRALISYADLIGDAQRLHSGVGDRLQAARGQLHWCAPWDIPDMISGVVDTLVDAIRTAIDAYQMADTAAEDCCAALERVADRMPFPEALAPGMSAFELMNVLSAREGQRPLVGDVVARASAQYDTLSAEDRARVDALMETAPSERHQAWILAAMAAGTSVDDLTTFAERIGEESSADLTRLLDPTAHQLVQQSGTTCGSASLVMAHMLNDPVYALSVLDPEETINERLKAEEETVHARTNDWTNESGLTMPWPTRLGTMPWGAAEEMNGAAGVDGTGYGATMVDSDSADDRQEAYDALNRAVADGRSAPVFVGNETLPRHVVLCIGRTDTGLQFYEPGCGGIVEVSEEDFVNGDVNLGGWDRPWAIVTP